MLLMLAAFAAGAGRYRPALAAVEAIPDGLRLILVEDPACVYCRKWLQEVGIGYALTSAGRSAPLVRRNINDQSLSAFSGLRFTPTFVLARDGRELERLVGYAGREAFWQSLSGMLERAGVDLRDDAPDGARQGPDATDT